MNTWTISWWSLKKEVEQKEGIQLLTVAAMLNYLYWERGMSLRELGQYLGVSYRTVSLKMKELGLKIRSRGGPNGKFKNILPKKTLYNSEKELLLDWKSKGMSSRDIRDKLKSLYGIDVSHYLVNRRLKLIEKGVQYVLRDRIEYPNI